MPVPNPYSGLLGLLRSPLSVLAIWRLSKAIPVDRAFVGTDLTNGRISSGLPVTRQEPQHICSIGALGVRQQVRTGRTGFLDGSVRCQLCGWPTLVTATPQPRR